MLKNYLKITLAVLWRNKFFTFISLFGISLTLATLMVAASLADHAISPNYPDFNRDRILYLSGVKLYDLRGGAYNVGAFSAYFCNHYLRSLKTPEAIGFISNGTPSTLYMNNKKISLVRRYANDRYWDIMRYHFIEGKPFDSTNLGKADPVAVITQNTRDNYFGTGAEAVGKTIMVGDEHFKVIGVVDNDPAINGFTSADVYLPYTISKADIHSKDIRGGFLALIMAPSPSALSSVQDEYYSMFAKIPLVDPSSYNYQFAAADPYLTSWVRTIFNHGNTPASSGGTRESTGIIRFYLIVGGLVLLFMLLPTISLVNINITRILERSSEIGVRKSFGASSSTLIYQFIVENIFLTLIGGFLGIVVSLIALYVLNNSGWIPDVQLTLNIRVLVYSLLLCLFFGFLSGVYPAWRMSRMQIIHALKA
jgi:putative ABC transport system permease protein